MNFDKCDQRERAIAVTLSYQRSYRGREMEKTSFPPASAEVVGSNQVTGENNFGPKSQLLA